MRIELPTDALVVHIEQGEAEVCFESLLFVARVHVYGHVTQQLKKF